jgi:quinol-cytochrome oxidoreductase complex cytochrome b subunit
MHKSLVLHFRPKMINRKALDFTMTFGLGGMAVILIVLLFGTGMLLKFYYLPFPDRAYDSILFLTGTVLFGPFIRNIHYWSANILVIVGFLHFLRVFFTSAFHPPRRLNWVIGIGMFFIILLFNFSGYLLPWDQLSFWAVTICTGMMEYIPWIGGWLQAAVRGGSEVGSSTLSVFYAAHTAFFPAAIIILLSFHFWRVRKAGGVVTPESSSAERDDGVDIKIPSMPDLILRELVVALVLTALILCISIFFNAPLGERANPGLSPNPTKAPWYFVGFQEILLHFHPLFAVCVIPLLIFLGLLRVAYSPYPSSREGIWFVSSKGRSMAIISFAAALLLTPAAIVLDEHVLDFAGLMPGVSPLISNGLIPFLITLSVCILLYLLSVKFFSPDKNEKMQMVVAFFITVFIVLTLTGVWFRGAGMKLVWSIAG